MFDPIFSHQEAKMRREKLASQGDQAQSALSSPRLVNLWSSGPASQCQSQDTSPASRLQQRVPSPSQLLANDVSGQLLLPTESPYQPIPALSRGRKTPIRIISSQQPSIINEETSNLGGTHDYKDSILVGRFRNQQDSKRSTLKNQQQKISELINMKS